MDRPSNRLNSLENYSEFLETGTSSIKSQKKPISKNCSLEQFANKSADASDINMLVKQKFFKAEYPTDLLTVNIFCPLCGKIVSSTQQFSAYQSEIYKRRFLAHDQCLQNNSHRLLYEAYDEVQEMIYLQKQREPKIKIFAIGDRQFCLQLTISHILSDFKYVKLVTKSHLNGSILRWELRKQQQQDQSSYEPNIICFPLIDFKITLIISQIGSDEQKKILSNYINLSKTKLPPSKTILVKSPSPSPSSCSQLSLTFNIHSTPKQKQDIISQMNFKYRYPQKIPLPIIQLSQLQIQIPQQQFQDEQDYENSNSITNLLSEEHNNESSVASSSFNCVFSGYQQQQRQQQQRGALFEGEGKKKGVFQIDNAQGSLLDGKFCEKSSLAEKEKVQFDVLNGSGKLSSYVRNGAQSRSFQKFLSEATPEQVDVIIKTLIDQFSDLVVDEYANYMTQKLFEVSNSRQKQIILQKLQPEIPNLVRNKQGTHTIQAFISTLILPQQITLITKSIRNQFQQLSLHPTSTHFIQKLIKTFPIQDTLQFYEYTNKHFLKFATDKNAMCVLKYMLRRVNDFKDRPITNEIRKHFINSITLNTHKIIQDCYGNYVVQFCYELFGEGKSSGITEMILEKFLQFSLQRYSSSVVSKCINLYWTDKGYALRLKDTLNGEGIIEMYRNKDGNKILLDLMDKNQNTPLQQKINNYLSATGQPSKFYHQRWDMQKGIKSGPVGFQFKSFTQATDNQSKKKDQNNGSKKGKKK